MEFRTKREAERAAMKEEWLAGRAIEAAVLYDSGSSAAARLRSIASAHHTNAARIRALLPTLPTLPD